jgi:hypothetical protein
MTEKKWQICGEWARKILNKFELWIFGNPSFNKRAVKIRCAELRGKEPAARLAVLKLDEMGSVRGLNGDGARLLHARNLADFRQTSSEN